MRRLVAALLACLPFDDRSRRALDQTLLDWQHEEHEAGGFRRRAVVGALALLGVARSVGASVAVEVGHIPAGWLFGRLALIAVVPTVLLAVPTGRFGVSAAWSWPTVEFGALLLPQAVIVVLPAALFLTIVFPPRDRAIPAVGLAILTFAVVLTIGGWVVPIANQQFRVSAYSLTGGVDRQVAAEKLPPGPAELGIRELVERIRNRESTTYTGVLLFKTGLAVLSAALVLLGARISRLPRPARLPWTLLIALTYCVSLSLLSGTAHWGAHAHAVFGAIPWLLAILILGWLTAHGLRLRAQD